MQKILITIILGVCFCINVATANTAVVSVASAVKQPLRLKRMLGNSPGRGYTNNFFFGDSLSDMGNFIPANPVPCIVVAAPVTTPIGTNGGHVYSSNSFQNGSAFFNGTPSNSGGNDYAVAGATVTPNPFNPNGEGNPFFMFASNGTNVNGQVGQYLINNGNQTYPDSLYIFWGGANDILDEFFFDPNVATNLPGVIQADMQAISAYIYMMEQFGATNFLFIGLPDLSKSPLAAAPFNPQTSPFNLVGAFNIVRNGVYVPTALHNASQEWDAALQATLQNNANYYRSNGTVIYYYDPTNAFNTIVSQPSGVMDGIPYNFTHTNQQVWCGMGDPNADSYMFFNYIHPSSLLHTILAADIMNNSAQL